MAELIFGTRHAVGKVFTMNRRLDVVVRGVVETPDFMSVARLDILLNIAMRDALRTRAGSVATLEARDEWDAGSLNVNNATLVLLPTDGSLTRDELERRLKSVSDRIVLPDGGTASFRVRPLKNHLGDSLTAAFGSAGIAPGISAIQLFFLPGLLVLAMACFNYANLATAIASARAKEVGLSKVLGAESRDIIKKYLFEALATVLTSLAIALVLGVFGIDVIRNLSGQLEVSAWHLVSPEFILMLVSMVAATTVAAGAYPAYVLSRFSPIEALRKGAKRSGSSLAKSVFIGVQFTAASVLLTAVMVMYAQNAAMPGADVGRLPSDPLVQLTTNLDTVNVDPDVLAAALLRAPQIKAVTGLQGFDSETGKADLYSRSPGSRDLPVRIRSPVVGYDFFSTLTPIWLPGELSPAAVTSSRAQRRTIAKRERSASSWISKRFARSVGPRRRRPSGKSFTSTPMSTVDWRLPACVLSRSSESSTARRSRP
jgi:hypothetical protein